MTDKQPACKAENHQSKREPTANPKMKRLVLWEEFRGRKGVKF
jgi:hypothetical protein